MTAWDANVNDLIAAGWGEHQRGAIPADWRTRRGPDPIPGQPHPRRIQAQEIGRANSWRHRRAAYLLLKAGIEV